MSTAPGPAAPPDNTSSNTPSEFERLRDEALAQYFVWRGEMPWRLPTDNYERLKENLSKAHIASVEQARKEAAIEGAEMMINELLQGAASINGVVELDSGELHIRANNLLATLKGEHHE